MIKITDEYRKVAREFRKTFGYSVPLSMIPPVADMSILIENIQKCIDNKEDNLLEVYEVVYNEKDLL